MMAPFGFLFLAFLSLNCVTYAILESFFGTSILSDLFPNLSNGKCVGASSNLTTFLLYSRNHPTDHRVLAVGDKTKLKESQFDPVIPTKIIIHGFLDNLQINDWMIKMKTELLMEGHYNVIIVDWSCGNGLPYNQAVENSKTTGNEVAELIKFLKDSIGAEPLDFHLIGHSLGSHIAAVVGQKIQRIGRITGLDPAGPKFYDAPPDQRLDPSDAEFVDAIHTDAGTGILEGFGMHEQVGHVDFYPNGGRSQPGCHASPFQVLQRIGLQRAARYFFTCDHFRAIDFFTASIRKAECDYVGVTCRNWKAFSEGRCANCSENRCVRMGLRSNSYHVQDPDATTKEFYLKTSDHNPFCLYQYQVVVSIGGNNSGQNLTVKNGILHLELKSQNGTYTDFKLNEGGKDSFRPGRNYIYLVTSAKPLKDADSASLSWKKKAVIPWTLRPTPAPVQHLKFRRLQITPISMPDRKSRELKSKTVLCASEEQAVFENQRLYLSADSC